MKRIVLTLVLGLTLVFGTLPGGAAAHRLPSAAFHGTSTNWAGYVSYGGGKKFVAVKSQWIQPRVICNTTETRKSSFWVGLDGYGSPTVEQIGTEAMCGGYSDPHYYAWWEMYPALSQPIDMEIHPGDAMAAEVTSGGCNFAMTLKNVTTGASFSTTQADCSAQKASAEVIAEAPSPCGGCGPYHLANFGTICFHDSYITNASVTGSFTNPAWTSDAITMTQVNGNVKAQPSALNSVGRMFSITWLHY